MSWPRAIAKAVGYVLLCLVLGTLGAFVIVEAIINPLVTVPVLVLAAVVLMAKHYHDRS